jgi:hypothetical protein
MKRTTSEEAVPASELIDARIAELGDWRGETLARVRKLIHEADPEVVETWKWMGTPVWEHDGIICTGETYKAVVKLTFLNGNARRAIDIRQGEALDASAFKALVKRAIALNRSGGKAKPKAKPKRM